MKLTHFSWNREKCKSSTRKNSHLNEEEMTALSIKIHLQARLLFLHRDNSGGK